VERETTALVSMVCEYFSANLFTHFCPTHLDTASLTRDQEAKPFVDLWIQMVLKAQEVQKEHATVVKVPLPESSFSEEDQDDDEDYEEDPLLTPRILFQAMWI
jgi:hypothetical protein